MLDLSNNSLKKDIYLRCLFKAVSLVQLNISGNSIFSLSYAVLEKHIRNCLHSLKVLYFRQIGLEFYDMFPTEKIMKKFIDSLGGLTAWDFKKTPLESGLFTIRHIDVNSKCITQRNESEKSEGSYHEQFSFMQPSDVRIEGGVSLDNLNPLQADSFEDNYFTHLQPRAESGSAQCRPVVDTKRHYAAVRQYSQSNTGRQFGKHVDSSSCLGLRQTVSYKPMKSAHRKVTSMGLKDIENVLSSIDIGQTANRQIGKTVLRQSIISKPKPMMTADEMAYKSIQLFIENQQNCPTKTIKTTGNENYRHEELHEDKENLRQLVKSATKKTYDCDADKYTSHSAIKSKIDNTCHIAYDIESSMPADKQQSTFRSHTRKVLEEIFSTSNRHTTNPIESRARQSSSTLHSPIRLKGKLESSNIEFSISPKPSNDFYRQSSDLGTPELVSKQQPAHSHESRSHATVCDLIAMLDSRSPQVDISPCSNIR